MMPLRSALLISLMLMSFQGMSRLEYKRSGPVQVLQQGTAPQGPFSLAMPEGRRFLHQDGWDNAAPHPAGDFDIPQFRKYQNKHIAPTRMLVGGGMMAAGGAMLIMGYRQDNKYEWSGPYPSLSPLNAFGAALIGAGLGFLISGLIFRSKFNKHTIAPYNKAY